MESSDRRKIIFIFSFFVLGLCIFLFFLTIQNQKNYIRKKLYSENKDKKKEILSLSESKKEISNKVNKTSLLNQKVFQARRKPTSLVQVPLENLKSNEILGKNWKVWAYTESVVKSKLDSTQIKLAEISNRYVIQSNDDFSDFTQFNKSKLIVIYNTRLKKAGLLTGQIKVLTHQKVKLESFLNQINATIENSFDGIHTYYVSSRTEIFDLQNLYLTLKEQDFVSHIELDLIDRSYEKN